jgi:hypothetical protein
MPPVGFQSREVLRCPASEGSALAADIRARGNLPLVFGHDSIIELTPRDISENWKAALAMKPDVAGAVAAELSARLSRSIEDDEDDAIHAGEAAACLFLSLRHKGLSPKHAEKGCRILWDQRHYSERVEFFG